jgi:hypothetical protein
MEPENGSKNTEIFPVQTQIEPETTEKSLRIAEESESIAEENESPLSLYFTTFCAEFWGGALRFGALGPAELDIRPPGRRSEPEWGWSSSAMQCQALVTRAILGR